jgi:hypothetical protein
MRTRHAVVAATVLFEALAPLAAPRAAETRQAPVCPSPEKAQQVAQGGGGAALPEGRRLVHVRRLDTPAGPVCGVDFAGGRGVTGAIADATTTTQWWTACANLPTR